MKANVLRSLLAKGAIVLSVVCLMFGVMACSHDKTSDMKKEVSEAYATASENLKNAKDPAEAAQVMEKLNTQLSGIQAKYKDVTENLTQEEKTTIDEFYKEQKDKLYSNATEVGKKAIDAVTSATSADAGAGNAVVDSSKSVKHAAEDSANSVQSTAKAAAEQVVNNAKTQAEQAAVNAKNAAKATVEGAKENARKKATTTVTNAQNKANEEVNKAADKANKSIEKGLNKVLGQ